MYALDFQYDTQSHVTLAMAIQHGPAHIRVLAQRLSTPMRYDMTYMFSMTLSRC
jgi:hypothetical protein